MLLAHLEDEESIHPGEVQLFDLEGFYKAAKNRFDTEMVLLKEQGYRWFFSNLGSSLFGAWARFIKLSLAHCQEIYQA